MFSKFLKSMIRYHSRPLIRQKVEQSITMAKNSQSTQLTGLCEVNSVSDDGIIVKFRDGTKQKVQPGFEPVGVGQIVFVAEGVILYS